jgi:SAM-dependent methyltransferase
MSQYHHADASALNGCCCVRCGAKNLRFVPPRSKLRQMMDRGHAWIGGEGDYRDDPEIRHGAIRCGSCSAPYDMIWGSPFLGAFDQQDVIGLVEIAANARADNQYPDATDIRRLDDLLSRYHRATDRNQFIQDEPDPWVRAAWFSNRYSEWSHFALLSEGISFAGMDILDVGAGTGVDTSRLVAAGANVTALEYNPMLVRRGKGAVPEARWIGGLSHCLPFASGTFDAVCCNAALHHMRDVSVALLEMLRVLKPGGWLITTGDSYRPRNSSLDTEFVVFNRHEGVLLGINESIPSFSAFEAVFLKYRDSLDIKLLTGVLYGARLDGDEPVNLDEIRWWDFEKDREMLGDASGNIGVRCQIKREITIPRRPQPSPILTAGAYAACLTDYAASIQKLAPHVPEDLLDRPFPGTEQTKWELLNGWQAPDGSDARIAYKRARWFLRRPRNATELTFEAQPIKAPDGHVARLKVLVNGKPVIDTEPLRSGWRQIAIPLKSIKAGETFVCEIQLHLEGPAEAEFDANTFRVRHRRFEGSLPSPAARATGSRSRTWRTRPSSGRC